MVKSKFALVALFIGVWSIQGCVKHDASSQLKIKPENSQNLRVEKSQQSQKPSDLNLPPVGNLQVTLLSKDKPEVFFAPYLIELEGFPAVMNLIFLPQIEYQNFKSSTAFQCHVLVALSQHLWDKNAAISPYLLDNSQIHLNNAKGSFLMVPSAFSAPVTGKLKSHGMDLISFDGTGKNTTLQGGASFLTKEDLYQLEQRCVRWKNGLPESER